MVADSDYFRVQAQKCRWFARNSVGHVRETLIAMATEYEAKAGELDVLASGGFIVEELPPSQT
jgi:hypothetical protein